MQHIVSYELNQGKRSLAALTIWHPRKQRLCNRWRLFDTNIYGGEIWINRISAIMWQCRYLHTSVCYHFCVVLFVRISASCAVGVGRSWSRVLIRSLNGHVSRSEHVDHRCWSLAAKVAVSVTFAFWSHLLCISREIGWNEHLHSDLFGEERDV